MRCTLHVVRCPVRLCCGGARELQLALQAQRTWRLEMEKAMKQKEESLREFEQVGR